LVIRICIYCGDFTFSCCHISLLSLPKYFVNLEVLVVEGLPQRVVQERLGTGALVQLGPVCLEEPSLAELVAEVLPP
jgi:hypothetical protein